MPGCLLKVAGFLLFKLGADMGVSSNQLAYHETAKYTFSSQTRTFCGTRNRSEPRKPWFKFRYPVTMFSTHCGVMVRFSAKCVVIIGQSKLASRGRKTMAHSTIERIIGTWAGQIVAEDVDGRQLVADPSRHPSFQDEALDRVALTRKMLTAALIYPETFEWTHADEWLDPAEITEHTKRSYSW